MRYRLLLCKRWMEDVLMWPLILLGRLIAVFRPLSRDYETFFFFPFYHIGGAEKVHLNIAQATGNGNCIIFFTRKSHNRLFYQGFQASGCEIRDISRYTDNKWIYFVNIIFRGILSGYVNRQQNLPLVFNGQCNFGYKLSPWIRKDIPQVELIHSLCSFSYIRIPFLPFISRTVMISQVRIAEHLELYKRYGISSVYGEKIRFILNGIHLPEPKTSVKTLSGELVALYVGRATPEKRVHLIAEMAERLRDNHRIRFEFLGEVKEAIPTTLRPYCKFWGNQSDPAMIDNIYAGADVLLLVSDTEGFPMVVMEAMARGLAVIATAVGEIPMHITEDVNGFLIKDFSNTQAVMDEGVRCLLQLLDHKDKLMTISASNIEHAYLHFGMTRFEEAYKNLFAEMRSKTVVQ